MLANLQLLAPGQSNLATFVVWKDKDSAQVWNGTAWTTDSNANLILGATAADVNAPAAGRAYYSYPVPAGVAARNWLAIAYVQHGGSPAVGDLTGYPALGAGGADEAAANTYASTDSVFTTIDS